jgi:para-aminobenzoate synthetase component I
MTPIAYLNSNNGSGKLFLGAINSIRAHAHTPISELQHFIEHHKGEYIVLALSYDLKNKFEKLTSSNHDGIQFPDFIAFVPETVLSVEKEAIHFLKGEKTPDVLQFVDFFLEEETDDNFHPYNFEFQARTTKEDYLKNVEKLKGHIQRGDIYEVNYCQEFFAEKVEIPYPLDAFFKVNRITKAPFSAYLSFDEFRVMCGSPERFVAKKGQKLLSQPIKGTAPRFVDKERDEAMKQALQNDPKEKAENVMIVDLVRNDLSKIAQKSSVKVDELMGIYSFETVHQMISTVSCSIDDKVSFTDVMKATFPMGSMTGAPKFSAMELAEKTEDFKRGLYSGSIGYIDPNGDFDLNVVIRTLLYNTQNQYLSCAVGGAITIQSDPEKEYEECWTKVKKLLDGFQAASE